MNSRHRGDRFESSSFTDLLTRPFRALGRSVRRSNDDHSIGENQSLFGRVVSFLTFPLRVLWAFIVFMVQSWASSRSAQAFLFGVPAVLVAGLFLSGLWTANFLKQSRSVGASQGYFKLFITKSPDKPELAELFARKLVVLTPENEDFKYQLGESLEFSKKMDEAVDIMSYLAPEGRPGNSDAHVWMARYYLRGLSPQLTEQESQERAVKHLEYAIQLSPSHTMALVLLSNIFEQNAKDYEQGSPQFVELRGLAIEQLTKAVDGPVNRLSLTQIPRLIQLLDEAGMKDKAKERLSFELNRLTRIARNNSDVFDIWLSLISAAVQTGEFEQAKQIINQGFQLAQTKEVRDKIKQLESQVVVEEAGEFENMQDRDDYRNRLGLLCDAVAISPQNRTIYLKLMDFVATKSNPDFNESWLRQSVIDCKPGIVHVLLGVHEMDKGNVLVGQEHWRIAEQQDPLTPYVVSFIVDVAAREYRDEFANLLDMISSAIELFPDQPTMYHTRGCINKEAGRFQEAAADFEYVVEKMGSLLSARRYLAICYQELGEPEKAAEQELIIEEILGGLDVRDRMQAEKTLENLN